MTTAGGDVDDGPSTGRTILSAVEKIVDGPECAIAFVERLRGGGVVDIDAQAEAVISHFSNRAAIVGGATAAPALLPIGLLASLVAGPLVDMVALLKLEVEMAVTLAAAHGYDVRDARERQLAFLLVAVRSVEITRDRSPISDGLDVTAESIWNYAPRRMGKALATALAILSLHLAARRALTLIPLVGIAVGAGMNKLLTQRVGRMAHADLHTRRRLQGIQA